MPVTIRIQSLEDAAKGMRIVDGATMENSESVDHFTMGILEKGTKGGQTTVMFAIKTEDGKYVIAQATGNEFDVMYKTFLAADEKFNPKV